MIFSLSQPLQWGCASPSSVHRNILFRFFLPSLLVHEVTDFFSPPYSLPSLVFTSLGSVIIMFFFFFLLFWCYRHHRAYINIHIYVVMYVDDGVLHPFPIFFLLSFLFGNATCIYGIQRLIAHFVQYNTSPLFTFSRLVNSLNFGKDGTGLWATGITRKHKTKKVAKNESGPQMFDIFRVKQGLKHCRQGREPPDPSLFPHYFQNAQNMWCHFTEWWPRQCSPSECTGVVYIVNGLGEHAGRYDGFAAFLNAKGFVVFSQDNQGAGGSEGLRLYVEKFTDFVRDVKDFIKFIETSRYPNEIREVLCQTDSIPSPQEGTEPEEDRWSQFPSDRRFLLGHSMGGLIAALLAEECQASFFGGIILSGPAFKLRETPSSVLRGVVRVLGKYMPKMKIQHLDSKQDLCSGNKPVKELLAQDPYYGHTHLRAHFVVEFIGAQDLMWKGLKRAEFSRLLLIHGTLDGLCSPEGSERFYREAKAVEKDVKLYADARHEVLTERCCLQVWSDVLIFLLKGVTED